MLLLLRKRIYLYQPKKQKDHATKYSGSSTVNRLNQPAIQNQLQLLRKHSAILFLLLFACAQYAKQLVYLECTLANTLISPDTLPCDCIRTAGLDQADKHNDLPLHSHARQYSEESVQLSKEIILPVPPAVAVKKRQVRYIVILPAGSTPLPWHPPCL